MAFVAPSGYAASSMGHSPRSGGNATFSPASPSASLSNPASLPTSQSSPGGLRMQGNAIAGPSGSGSGLDYSGYGMSDVDNSSRRTSKEDMYVTFHIHYTSLVSETLVNRGSTCSAADNQARFTFLRTTQSLCDSINTSTSVYPHTSPSPRFTHTTRTECYITHRTPANDLRDNSTSA
jgi:hypothetical protein